MKLEYCRVYLEITTTVQTESLIDHYLIDGTHFSKTIDVRTYRGAKKTSTAGDGEIASKTIRRQRCTAPTPATDVTIFRDWNNRELKCTGIRMGVWWSKGKSSTMLNTWMVQRLTAQRVMTAMVMVNSAQRTEKTTHLPKRLVSCILRLGIIVRGGTLIELGIMGGGVFEISYVSYKLFSIFIQKI